MNANLRNSKTINSFLAAQKSEVRQSQISGLESYVSSQREKNSDAIHFVKYWGASNKSALDNYDYDALLNLFGFVRVVEKEYKMNVQLTLVFTDTHALLNGYSRDGYREYYKQLRSILNKFNYIHIFMSDIIKPYLRLQGMEDTSKLITFLINRSKKDEMLATLKRTDSFQLLKRSASKHSCRYFESQRYGDWSFDTPDQSAYAYILLNQIEAAYIGTKFLQNIFLTYMSESETELIAPHLPSVQLFSYRSGIRSRPWFSYCKTEIQQPCAELLQ